MSRSKRIDLMKVPQDPWGCREYLLSEFLPLVLQRSKEHPSWFATPGNPPPCSSWIRQYIHSWMRTRLNSRHESFSLIGE